MKKWIFIPLGVFAGLLVLLLVIGTITVARENNTAVPAKADRSSLVPTQAATAVPQSNSRVGTVLLDVSGNGTKKTQFFTAPKNWDIVWEADGGGFGSYFGVFLYNENNDPVDVAVNSMAQQDEKLSDITHEHRSGTFYLDINASGPWHIKVVTA